MMNINNSVKEAHYHDTKLKASHENEGDSHVENDFSVAKM